MPAGDSWYAKAISRYVLQGTKCVSDTTSACLGFQVHFAGACQLLRFRAQDSRYEFRNPNM